MAALAGRGGRARAGGGGAVAQEEAWLWIERRTQRSLAPPNANGAGIAADPTLTDAWPAPKSRTWHPMFRRRPPPKQRTQGLSPALAPASGSTLRRVRQRAIGAEAVSSLAYPTLNGQLRGRTPWPVPRAVALRSARKPLEMPPSGAGREIPARDRIPTRFLHRVPCVRPKPSARGHSRCERTDPAASFRFGILR